MRSLSDIPIVIMGYIETTNDKLLFEQYYAYRTEAASVANNGTTILTLKIQP